MTRSAVRRRQCQQEVGQLKPTGAVQGSWLGGYNGLRGQPDLYYSTNPTVWRPQLRVPALKFSRFSRR